MFLLSVVLGQAHLTTTTCKKLSLILLDIAFRPALNITKFRIARLLEHARAFFTFFVNRHSI